MNTVIFFQMSQKYSCSRNPVEAKMEEKSLEIFFPLLFPSGQAIALSCAKGCRTDALI